MSSPLWKDSELNQKETFRDRSKYAIKQPLKKKTSLFFDNKIGRLMTVSELARLLNCNPGTIRNWVCQGIIPVVRPAPRMVRFSLNDIEKWLSERSSPYEQQHQ